MSEEGEKTRRPRRPSESVESSSSSGLAPLHSGTVSEEARSPGMRVLMMPCPASGHVPSRLYRRRVSVGCWSATLWEAACMVTARSPL